MGSFIEQFRANVPTMHKKKSSFLIRISSVNVFKSQEIAKLVTYTEEILNGKLQLLCSVRILNQGMEMEGPGEEASFQLLS